MRCRAYYCCLFILMACAEPQPQIQAKVRHSSNAITVKNDKQEHEAKDELALEAFTTFPKNTKGCSAVFATDTIALQNKTYYLVSSSTGKAYIKINDRLITLKLDDKIDEATFIKETYKGAGYLLNLVMHKIRKNEDGTWQYAGEILVLKNNEQASKPVVGIMTC